MEIAVVKKNERTRRGAADRMLMGKPDGVVGKRELVVLSAPSPNDASCLPINLCDLVQVTA